MKMVMEQQMKEWESFTKKIKDNPTATVTNEEFTKVIDFFSENLEGMSQMLSSMVHNMNVLNTNFNQIIGALQGNGQPPVNKTKSGIILP